MRLYLRLAARQTGAGLLAAAGVTAVVILWSAPAGGAPKAMLVGQGSSMARLDGPATPSREAAPASTSRSAFSIWGYATGLYPGGPVPLTLTVTNPQQFAIIVRSIVTTVAGTSAACPGSDLSVESFGGSLYVPSGGHASTTVTATLTHGAPDACQGAVFTLQYSGQGQKA